MSKKVLLRCTLAVVLPMILLNGVAWGWQTNTHYYMAYNSLTYPTITPYLSMYGLNAHSIADMAWELDLPGYKDEYHSDWDVIVNRAWLTDPKWNNLSEERRLAFLLHCAADTGVPMGGHSPLTGSSVFLEGVLEARVALWQDDMPSITPYTGTYVQKMQRNFQCRVVNAVCAEMAINNFFDAMFGSNARNLAWDGLANGQNLGEAMLLEYFQTRGGGVPEPATLSLLLAGGLGVVIRRRK